MATTLIQRSALALVLAACLPLTALADARDGKDSKDGKGHRRPDVQAPARGASAPEAGGHARHAHALDHSAELQRNRTRGASMGACMKEAADQKLAGVERKQFIGSCMQR